ncbi:HD-GYP domain-containing protein [Methylobacterium sp. CM6257]
MQDGHDLRAVVLDDGELNNLVMVAALQPIAGCAAHAFTVPAEALAFAAAHADEIGVFITDYEMPGMNGVEVIHALRRNPDLASLPIIMVTSYDARSVRQQALVAGATDFLSKPADPVEIRARVSNLLALARAHKVQRDHAAHLAREVAAAVALVEEREREIVSTLMRAAEDRDTNTGNHIARVSAYTGLIAEALGLPATECRLLSLAATMHDVGKIAVPDSILLKPGPLTPEELREMERHTERGGRILGGSTSVVMRLAAEIAVSHHECWDGSGYPHALKGEAIPLAGRIVAVADVFDALTTERPYKRAWSSEEARAYLAERAGAQFDPQVVEALLRQWSQVEASRRAIQGPQSVPKVA